VKKFYEITFLSSDVLTANTLNFKSNFKAAVLPPKKIVLALLSLLSRTSGEQVL